ncbi:MAG: hypothetical protein H6578_11075 [Chitinophagales bacterium]|nr:hypothetical protein [Chitinophagales bacterium]
MKRISLITIIAFMLLATSCKNKCNRNMDFKEELTVGVINYGINFFVLISKEGNNFIPDKEIYDDAIYVTAAGDDTIMLKYNQEGYANFEDFYRQNKCEKLYLYMIPVQIMTGYWYNRSNTGMSWKERYEYEREEYKVELTIEKLNSKAWQHIYNRF